MTSEPMPNAAKLLEICQEAYRVCLSPESAWLAKAYQCQEVNAAIITILPRPDDPQIDVPEDVVGFRIAHAGVMLSMLRQFVADENPMAVFAAMAFHGKLCAIVFG